MGEVLEIPDINASSESDPKFIYEADEIKATKIQFTYTIPIINIIIQLQLPISSSFMFQIYHSLFQD